MITASDIEHALHDAVPPELHPALTGLSQTLAGAASGELSGAELRDRLVSDAPLLQALAGKAVSDDRTSVEFGHDGDQPSQIQIGDVQRGMAVKVVMAVSGPVVDLRGAQAERIEFRGDVTGGDIYKVHVTVVNRERVAGVPLQAPQLPENFVPRPEVTEAPKARLVERGDGGQPWRVVAVHGLAGSGKSTVAIALVRDPAVVARFPDGVLWATLGQDPKVLTLLGGWIQALGDHEFRLISEGTASAHLRTLMQDKAALLVVDDAWDPALIRHFMVGGPGSAALITTRDALVAREAGAIGEDLYELGVMTPEQAESVLAGGPGKALDLPVRGVALEVADAVGYLPLALELAAAQAADDVSWSELLEDLRSEVFRLETLEAPGADEVADETTRKRWSLVASLNLSVRRLSPQRQERLAWLGLLAEDAPITQALGSALWATDDRDARDTLRYLRDKALLAADTSDGDRTYRIHDLVHDLARNILTAPTRPPEEEDITGLGLKLPQAHAEFLERYRARCREGLWHTVPADGYIHDHLVWHLGKAGLTDEIHMLLAEETPEARNGWFEARDQVGESAGYVADLAVAWHLAESELVSRLQVKDDRRPDSVAFEVLYALVLCSLNSLAANIPPELLAALVDAGLWTAPRALAYARQVPTEARIRSLILVGCRLPDPSRTEVIREALTDGSEVESSVMAGLVTELAGAGMLDEALRAARSVDSPSDRGAALAAIAQHLPQSNREAILREALLSLLETNQLFLAGDLEPLVGLFPEGMVRHALESVQSIDEVLFRSWAQATLVGRLAQVSEPSGAFDLAKSIESDTSRAEALAAVAPYLPEQLRDQAVAQAFDVVRSIDEESERRAVGRAISRLPDLTRTMVMGAVGSQSSRATCLALLAPSLPSRLRLEAIGLAASEANPLHRSLALSALIKGSTEPEALRIASLAIDAARMLPSTESRIDLLARIADSVPHPRHDEVLREALHLTRAENSDGFKSSHLAALAPLLPSSTYPEVLDITATIASAEDRAKALGSIAPRLPASLLPRALSQCQSIGDQFESTMTLSALACLSPDHLAERTLATILTIDSDWRRASGIATIAKGLSGPSLDMAVRAASMIQDPESRGEVALAALAPLLEEPRATQAFRDALEVGASLVDPEERLSLLEALVDKLPPDLLEEALAVARGTRNAYGAHSMALGAVAPRLDEPHRTELLREAIAALGQTEAGAGMEPDSYFSEGLRYLASHLTEELAGDALKLARTIQEPRPRAYALAALASALSGEAQASVVGEALEIAGRFGPDKVGGPPEEDQEWVVATLLPTWDDLARALELAQMFGYEEPRAQAIASLAPGLGPELAGAAFDTAQSMQDPASRRHALASLVPRVSEDLRERVIEETLLAACEMDRADHRSTALEEIVKPLADGRPDFLVREWHRSLRILASRRREDLLMDLRALAPLIRTLGGVSAVDGAYGAIERIGIWWP